MDGTKNGGHGIVTGDPQKVFLNGIDVTGASSGDITKASKAKVLNFKK